MKKLSYKERLRNIFIKCMNNKNVYNEFHTKENVIIYLSDNTYYIQYKSEPIVKSKKNMPIVDQSDRNNIVYITYSLTVERYQITFGYSEGNYHQYHFDIEYSPKDEYKYHRISDRLLDDIELNLFTYKVNSENKIIE